MLDNQPLLWQASRLKHYEAVMQKLLNLFRMVAGQTRWHESTIGDRFVWRRWADGAWQYREMTAEEAMEAHAWWAIR
ncbi:hypothetical protein HJB79_31420 [Rhizobium lentis]|uniref:hypothetical protein n=1 Tax=Rhizobium lentis TaxID=1138194 RepID=UPI001C837157|nr:hypothetical protein [Rhizobium lentis]MBX5143220.1 hypothetical protein [Rhizobium lentis]